MIKRISDHIICQTGAVSVSWKEVGEDLTLISLCIICVAGQTVLCNASMLPVHNSAVTQTTVPLLSSVTSNCCSPLFCDVRCSLHFLSFSFSFFPSPVAYFIKDPCKETCIKALLNWNTSKVFFVSSTPLLSISHAATVLHHLAFPLVTAMVTGVCVHSPFLWPYWITVNFMSSSLI